MNVIANRWIVGVSGASGMRYALRFIEALAAVTVEVHLVFSDSAIRVLAEEENITLTKLSAKKLFPKVTHAPENLIFHAAKDIGASIASGSFLAKGMVIIPCSMSTLGAIAHGLSLNLLQRAADVTLKEGRKLIMVPRETPLTAIHLRNMLTLAELGVSIVPAMPGFYHQPKSVEDLINMMVMKVLDVMGISNSTAVRWKDGE